MFFRVKRTRGVDYLQLVANERHGPHVQQRVLASLGRLDDLKMSGELQRLVDAGAMLSGDGLLLVPPFSKARLELVPDSHLQEALLAAVLEGPGCAELLDKFCAGDAQVRRLVSAVAFGTLADLAGDPAWVEPLQRLGADEPQVMGDTAANILALGSAYGRGGGKESLRFCVRVAGNRTQMLRGLVTGLAITESGVPIAAAHWSAHLPPIKTVIDVGSQLARRLETGDITLVLDQSFAGGSFLPALSKLNVPFVVPVRQPSSRFGRRGVVGLVANDVRPPARVPGDRNDRGGPPPPPDPQLRYIQIVDPQAAQRDWRLRTAQLERVQSTIEAIGGATAGQAFARLDQARKELVDGERWDGTAIIATNLKGPAIEAARAFLAGSAVRDWEDELADFGQLLLEQDISPRDTSAMLTGGAAVLLIGRHLRHVLLEMLGGRLRQTDWDEFKAILEAHRSVRISQGERSVTLAPEPPPALRVILDALSLPRLPEPERRRPMRRGAPAGPMRRA